MEHIKLVFVGDGLVGKTAFLIRVTTQQLPSPFPFVATVFDDYEASVMVKGKPFLVGLYDTGGLEDYDCLRPLSYPGTDVFVVCFSVASRSSFENVTQKWTPEVRHFGPDVPILLLGTKTDLRNDSNASDDRRIVTNREGRALAASLGVPYAECSSLLNYGVQQAIETAVELYMYESFSPQRSSITKRVFKSTSIPPAVLEKMNAEHEQRVQLNAYKRAVRDGSVNVYRGRIFLIGQGRAGKTSLKKSLIGLPFDTNEQSTEGIQVDPSAFKVNIDQVKNWQSIDQNSQRLLGCAKVVARMVVERQFHKDDDANKERKIAKMLGKEDVDNDGDDVQDYNDAGDEGKDPYIDQVTDESNVDAVSKQTSAQSDLTIDPTSLPDEIRNQLTEYRRKHVKKGVSKEESVVIIDIWDFAGQHLYYASHPVFFSLQAIYVLVYNLSKSLNETAQPCVRQGTRNVILENPSGETNVENLLSWLSTVHGITKMRGETVDGAHGKLPYLQPPVLIVGTHADKPFEDIATMKSEIRGKIAGKEYEGHVVMPIFSIDNTATSLQHRIKKVLRPKKTEQEGNIDKIQALRNKIMEVLKQQPYMGQKIPVRWLHFEKVVDALVAKNINHISVEQLQAHARKVCFVEDRDEFNAMVEFYHNLGMIIKHSGTVILKTQWLIDLFKQLITIPQDDKAEPKHSKHWQELEKNGVLNMELVDHVFSKLFLQGVVKDDILHMMERFGLVAKFSTSSSDVKYFVPAQLKASPDDLSAVHPSPSDPCPLYVHFVVGFVPHGLFTQLVSRSIRWCSMKGSTQYPKLYQNGARFVIGKQIIHHLILICKKRFIKVVLKQITHSQQVSEDDSTEVAAQVRELVESSLHGLSQDLPYLRGLQYQLCVACPYCQQGNHECTNHRQTACTHEDCLHLLEIKQGEPLICIENVCDKVLTVHGQEKWLSHRASQDLHPSPVGSSQSHRGHSHDSLKITLLASEWGSSKGGLSTMNRMLAILFAKQSKVEVTILVPQCSCGEEDKRAAATHNIAIREAPRLLGYKDLDWLSFPPEDLDIDVIVGHGAKLGKQAQVIRGSHGCKWVQVVHTAPEELGMYKSYPGAVAQGEEKYKDEVALCRLADRIVAVGPKLAEAYLSSLRSSHQHIFQLTPGTFLEFSDVTQALHDSGKFRVLTFGRGDFEDFSLKGYDIAAEAIVELKESSYHLICVGAPNGKQDEVAEKLLQIGISKNQLTVRSFMQSKDELKNLFCEVDLAIMPSRTEGFGLTGLEAMSAGLPILVSSNSGFGKSLCSLPFGGSFVVESEDPKEWAKAISAVRQKDRAQRLQEIQTLRTKYEEKFSWEKQCQDLVDNMRKLVVGKEY